MVSRLRTLIVSMLGLALLAWFLRHGNLAEVWGAIRSADVTRLGLATLLFLPMMVMRAARWLDLLRPLGAARLVVAFRTTIIGFAASNVLPARVGEVLRPYLLARHSQLSATSAFATIVVERILDLMAVLTLLALYLMTASAGDVSPAAFAAIRTAAAVAALTGFSVLVGMAVLSHHPERIGRLVLRAERLLPHRMAHILSRVARSFSEGLAVARTPRALAAATMWTFALWITIAAQSWLVTTAFGIAMPVLGSFLLQALLVIGIAVPTPGGVGGFHEAYRIGATSFFHASNEAAVGAAIVLHAISFIPTTLIGAALMVHEGLSIGRLRALARSPADEMAVSP